MDNDPQYENKMKITPEQLWNSLGMIQQAVMSILLLFVYVLISIIISRSVSAHPGLENWMQNLQNLFHSDSILTDLIWGAFAGFGMVLLLSVLDIIVAFIGRKDIREWIHRTDYMLPVTRIQKRWALSISLSGSIVEEIMFRGFIYMAIIPLWSHWIWAALLLSAVFSLLHASVQGFWSTLWIFMISIFLCYFISQGGSIYFVAIAHVVINITNLLILPLFFKKRDE
ncbi:MAG: CPBP family intramembrane glutamic endopeptidase [Candidatus Marinimicrobia bacterium]|nr:CPBP family intramembrane glutamic endopeptidase [Candidatus Neomarinimicrobiota bacterium]